MTVVSNNRKQVSWAPDVIEPPISVESHAKFIPVEAIQEIVKAKKSTYETEVSSLILRRDLARLLNKKHVYLHDQLSEETESSRRSFFQLAQEALERRLEMFPSKLNPYIPLQSFVREETADHFPTLKLQQLFKSLKHERMTLDHTPEEVDNIEEMIQVIAKTLRDRKAPLSLEKRKVHFLRKQTTSFYTSADGKHIHTWVTKLGVRISPTLVLPTYHFIKLKGHYGRKKQDLPGDRTLRVIARQPFHKACDDQNLYLYRHLQHLKTTFGHLKEAGEIAPSDVQFKYFMGLLDKYSLQLKVTLTSRGVSLIVAAPLPSSAFHPRELEEFLPFFEQSSMIHYSPEEILSYYLKLLAIPPEERGTSFNLTRQAALNFYAEFLASAEAKSPPPV